MILTHAKTLAERRIYRTSNPGILIDKTDQVIGEDLIAEDWEPFCEPAAIPPSGDCGCNGENPGED